MFAARRAILALANQGGDTYGPNPMRRHDLRRRDVILGQLPQVENRLTHRQTPVHLLKLIPVLEGRVDAQVLEDRRR
jgi:hypothetical protein